jgi:N-acetylmuramoyl-L-alanine amidase
MEALTTSAWEQGGIEPLRPTLKSSVIAVDPGHGGRDPGAIGPNGLRECDVVLDICHLMVPALRELGWVVYMTRAHDTFVGLSQRVQIATDYEADLLVSVHANSFRVPQAHGFEVWTSPGDTASDPIATRIYKSAKRTFPTITGRPDLSDGDPDKEARFTVLMGPQAAVLVETAFISNPREEAWLADPGFRLRMAGAIVTGVGSPPLW